MRCYFVVSTKIKETVNGVVKIDSEVKTKMFGDYFEDAFRKSNHKDEIIFKAQWVYELENDIEKSQYLGKFFVVSVLTACKKTGNKAGFKVVNGNTTREFEVGVEICHM